MQERTPFISMMLLFGPALLVAVIFAAWIASRGVLHSDASRAELGRAVLVVGLLMVGLSLAGEPLFALLAAILVVLLATGWQQIVAPCAGRSVPPAALFCWLVAAWAVCILIGTELIFSRDTFGSRMNTSAKFLSRRTRRKRAPNAV